VNFGTEIEKRCSKVKEVVLYEFWRPYCCFCCTEIEEICESFLGDWHNSLGRHTSFIAQNCAASFSTYFDVSVQQGKAHKSRS
jgi:hypothetical protein